MYHLAFYKLISGGFTGGILMKGVILAAGKGSRLREVTNELNKCLFRVNGISLIKHNVERMCSLKDITECIIVVGYGAEAVMREIGNVVNNKKIVYCIQQEQRGLVHALESAMLALNKEDFFMILGDEVILEDNYSKAVAEFIDSNVYSSIGIIEVDDVSLVRKTYTFRMDDNGNMSDFLEKPDVPYNSYMGTGNVFFKGEVLDLLAYVPISEKRGEKELVDVFNLIIERNHQVSSFVVGRSYININTREDIDMLEDIMKVH